MANSVKGEVEFEANGKTYTFKLGTNAQVLIEDRVGITVSKWMAERGDNLGAADIRLLMWAGLHRKHGLSEDEVGDLIDEIGAEKAADIFLRAITVASAGKTNGADGNRPSMPAKEPIGIN